jgi:Carbohydrate binding module (family 6)/Bacterial TSP3 repeat
MDNVTAIMHANYSLTEQSVFVANSGENVFTGERKLNRGYDGATSIKNCHLVGWQADNANYVQNTGGAMKHVNYRVSGLTMDHLGPPRMAFPDYSKIPKGGVGANDAENPRFWSYVHWDMDGSLAGKPNTSIITNHPLGRDGTEERYSNWTNLYRTDRRFAYLLIDAVGDPKMTLTRTKAGTPKVGQYYINDDAPGGFYGTFIHFPVIVNDGFLYTIQFESLGTNKSMTFHMKDDYVPDDEVLYKIKDFGRLPGVSISNATKKNTLEEVQSSGTTSYAIVGNDLYFMMVSKTTTPDFSCNITWTSNITLPMLDTDGDGISDYQESVNGTDPIPNDPIPTRPVLQLPKPVTAWEFNKAGDVESWTMAKSLTGSVSAGSHQLKVTGTDPQFNSPSNLFVPASDYGFLRFRMKSDKAGTLQIYYGTNEESNFTGSKVKVIAIEASPNDFVEYVVDMSAEANWTGLIYQLRLDPEVGLNGNVSIDHISFQKTNQLDCNKQWAGTATVNSCNKCVGGTTGLALNACDVVKAPYSGTAINIPGTIEAENFDKGGEGLGYSDTDTDNKGGVYRLTEGVDIAAITDGYAVGWAVVGEWLEYTVNVSTAGTYDIEFLTSSMNGGGEISLLLDGQLLKDKMIIPKTSDWSLYASSTVRVTLPKGKKVLRLRIDKSGFNIDKMIFTSVITANEESVELEVVSIFPNPSNTGIFHLTSSKNWEVYSTLGHLLAQGSGTDVNISTMAQGVYFIKLEETFYKIVKE